MLKSIGQMETNQWKIGEIRPGVGQIDFTSDWITILKARIEELDQILSEHGEK